jgi:hypothetical protein
MQCILENSSCRALGFISPRPLVLIASVRPAHCTSNLEPWASLGTSMLRHPEQNTPRCCPALDQANRAQVWAQATVAHALHANSQSTAPVAEREALPLDIAATAARALIPRARLPLDPAPVGLPIYGGAEGFFFEIGAEGFWGGSISICFFFNICLQSL